jgi:hypothetical protein
MALNENNKGKLGLFSINCNNSVRKLGNGDSQNDQENIPFARE